MDDELKQALMWPMNYDLHTHSNASDGEYSPSELVKYAKDRKVEVIALTDHDTCMGVDEAIATGKEIGVHVVTGVELSSLWHSNQIHIVGLCIDHKNVCLQEFINKQTEKRVQRAIEIGEKLEKCGFKNAYEKAKLLCAEGGTITRGTYATLLYNEGAEMTQDRCFAKYLAKGGKAYVKPKWDGIDCAIEAIKQAGGLAVLAHPKCYDMNNKWLRKLITDFKKQGGDGIEVSGVMMNQTDRDFLASLSCEYELLASCGSDFHRIRNFVDLGFRLTIPEKAKPIWYDSRFRLKV